MKRSYLKVLGFFLGIMGLGVATFLFMSKKDGDFQPRQVIDQSLSSNNQVQTVKTDQEKPRKKTICLSMIVKNESPVITRCLATVKPIIDYWIVVDTGSQDGTPQIIKDYMKDIPGELYEHPWVDFAHNRNQALEYTRGKADYALFIDADEMLEYAPDFKLPELNKDSYLMTLLRGNVEYGLTSLVRTDMGWKWIGVLHEYLSCPEAKTIGRINGVVKTTKSDGARTKDPQKYLKDIHVLQTALEKEPDNDRYMFYLAQSFHDYGDFEDSIETYQKRVAMGGWDQEVFYSLWQIARMQEYLGKDTDTIVSAYKQAFMYRPTRAEPLNDLAKYYMNHKDFENAYKIASIARTIPRPNDVLFVEKTAYDFDIELEYSVAAYWTGRVEECQKVNLELLARPNLEDPVRKLVENNLAFANKKLVEQMDQVSSK